MRLYEHREGIRTSELSETEKLAALAEAERFRGQAFERVMLLGGDDVVEARARPELHSAIRAIDWQATEKTTGALAEWRELHRVAFRGINEFHEAARVDLGVQGKVSGERHPERDLLLPAARREGEAAP